MIGSVPGLCILYTFGFIPDEFQSMVIGVTWRS